ncbi:hypothetical protein [Streptomyces sp. NBC_00582]|uniref:hypothetical protein n=1 Tax=Streptomyces sp. NBC_00582 TaxID=2975783 RepID=UPI002E80BD08|nr:hypothetical protein [Streptomyces sp. NBC_00582]WUB63848.1 hypothetical protein OG852_27380 [Streptomyces sp. NBC_00582]
MSARDDLYLFAMIGKVQEDGNRAMAQRKLDAHHAEVLNEAAAEADKTVALFEDSDEGAAAAGAMEGIALRFRRMAREKSSPTGADATPDFFQPGHLYAYEVWRFHCATVTAHPTTGERTAIGWIRISDGSWTTYAYSAAEWGGSWTDITTTGKDGRS